MNRGFLCIAYAMLCHSVAYTATIHRFTRTSVLELGKATLSQILLPNNIYRLNIILMAKLQLLAITDTMEKEKWRYLFHRSGSGYNFRYKQHVQILVGGWNHPFCRTVYPRGRHTSVYRNSRSFLMGNDREQMFQIRYLQAGLQTDWITCNYLLILTDLV